MNVQCCKCKRIREDGEWVLAPAHLEGMVSHTYCPRCADELLMELFSDEACKVAHKSTQHVVEVFARLAIPA